MSRRVLKPAVALLVALILTLSAPSAFAAPVVPSFDGPGDVFKRVVRTVKKVVKGLLPANSDDQGIIYPTPPKP